jgi:hypothetical protein
MHCVNRSGPNTPLSYILLFFFNVKRVMHDLKKKKRQNNTTFYMLPVCFHTFHSAQHTVIAGFVVSSRSIDLHGQICVKEIALQETLKLLLASDRWKLA